MHRSENSKGYDEHDAMAYAPRDVLSDTTNPSTVIVQRIDPESARNWSDR